MTPQTTGAGPDDDPVCDAPMLPGSLMRRCGHATSRHLEEPSFVTGEVCEACVEEKPDLDPEHPANCGGQYNGIGFMDPEQQRHRARCANHGLRLVETRVRHGPYYYVAEER